MSSPRRPLLWLLAALAPLVAYTVQPALQTIFTRFSLWDDEGYVMMSVASFLDGHPLYDEVFSQYGPFYFLFKWAVYSIADVPVSHDATRFTTVAVWLLSATTCAALVMQHTRSLALAVACYGLSFVFLTRLSAEPGHPQELAVLLVALAMLAATARRPGPRAALLGATVAATLLVKINIGVLLALAVAAAAFSGSPRDARGPLLRRATSGLLALAVLAVPVLLTRRHLDTTWGISVALVTTLTAGTTLWASRRSQLNAPGPRELGAFGAGLLVTGLTAVGFVLARGTTAAALLDAILVAPLAFSGKFFVADFIPLTAPLFAGTSLALASSLLWRRAGGANPLTPRRLARLRGVLGLAAVACVLTEAGPARVFFFIGPFVWLTLARAPQEPEPPLGRRVLAFGAALQLLVLYPVASSQTTWATFLLIPLALSGLGDTWATLRPVPLGRPARLAALLAVYVGYLLWSPSTAVHTPSASRLFPVQGAGRLRLPTVQAGTAHWVIQNLRAHGRTFFSMPGQNSFYFWTGMQPPTVANHNYWMLLFGPQRQADLATRFAAMDDLLVLVYPLMVGSWQNFGSEDDEAPLVDALQHSWQMRLYRSGFEIHARTDDESEWREYFLYGPMAFDGQTVVPLPQEILPDAFAGTLTGWFRTAGPVTGPAVALGAQDVPTLEDGGRHHAALLAITGDGHLASALDADAEPLTSPAPVDDGRWHHWALAFSRAELQLYLDGELVGRHWRPVPSPPLRQMQLGAGLGSPGWIRFAGELADVALWPRRAPPEEILEQAAAGPHF